MEVMGEASRLKFFSRSSSMLAKLIDEDLWKKNVAGGTVRANDGATDFSFNSALNLPSLPKLRDIYIYSRLPIS